MGDKKRVEKGEVGRMPSSERPGVKKGPEETSPNA